MNLESTLPLTPAEILSGAWQGISQVGRGKVAIVHIFPSRDEPGYVHYRVKWLPDHFASWSKRPVLAAAVGMVLDFMLAENNKTAADLAWQPSCIPVMDIDADGRRATREA